MVISAGILLIFLGGLCLWQRDLAWMLVEADVRLTGGQIERTAEWEALTRTQGGVMLLLGVIGVLVGLR